jgi:hypothetical protein
VSGFPPSLQVTPARIRDYLRTHKVPCRKCGYPLLGLPEPRCPECGAWTDVTARLRVHNLRLIKNSLGSLGTADEYLLRRSSGDIRWLCPFDEVEELKVVNRWSGRTRRWMILLGCLSLAEAFAFLVLLATCPGPQGALGMAAFMSLGMILVILAVGLDPERWVMVHTTGPSHKVPLHIVSESEANAGVDRLMKVVEEGRGRPPTADLDPQTGGVKEGCCHRCGYDLDGPRLMIDVPSKGAQALGVLAITFSIMFLFCGGGMAMESMFGSIYGSPEILPCAGTVGISAGAFILGILLTRRKHEVPAVPDWEGPGQCPACGWRATPDSPPIAGSGSNQA